MGVDLGRVRCRNFCQPDAPSTSAASNGSWGRDRMPASRMMTMNGVLIQISATRMVIKPRGVSINQGMKWLSPVRV